MVIRVATWNIDRSGVRGLWRAAEQAKLLESIQAHIYVVTETHDTFQLFGNNADHLSAPGTSPYKPADRAVGIWSTLPVVQKIPTSDPRLTACVELASEVGSMLVYGTIIPYRDEGRAVGLKNWEAHRQACRTQLADWQSLRRQFPQHHLLIAGDFNMTLGDCNSYVDQQSRAELLAGCSHLGLKCLTDFDLRPVVGRANIDHIFVSSGFGLVEDVFAWPGSMSVDGVPRLLSDHNGVLATLARAPAAD